MDLRSREKIGGHKIGGHNTYLFEEISIVSHCCPVVEFRNPFNINIYSNLRRIFTVIDLKPISGFKSFNFNNINTYFCVLSLTGH